MVRICISADHARLTTIAALVQGSSLQPSLIRYVFLLCVYSDWLTNFYSVVSPSKAVADFLPNRSGVFFEQLCVRSVNNCTW